MYTSIVYSEKSAPPLAFVTPLIMWLFSPPPPSLPLQLWKCEAVIYTLRTCLEAGFEALGGTSLTPLLSLPAVHVVLFFCHRKQPASFIRSSARILGALIAHENGPTPADINGVPSKSKTKHFLCSPGLRQTSLKRSQLAWLELPESYFWHKKKLNVADNWLKKI